MRKTFKLRVPLFNGHSDGSVKFDEILLDTGDETHLNINNFPDFDTDWKNWPFKVDKQLMLSVQMMQDLIERTDQAYNKE